MFLVKLALSNLIIVACVLIGRRFPTLGGLIATMPLTSLIVLIWLASDNPGNARLLGDYTRGVLWGILPTIGFFVAALLCLRRGIGLPAVLAVAGAVWLAGALLHQFSAALISIKTPFRTFRKGAGFLVMSRLCA